MNHFNKILRTIYSAAILLLSAGTISAQQVLIHSHNDYRQRVPFYQAYAQQLSSIEVDIFATGKPKELLVAHDPHELPSAPSIDQAYIQPLAELYERNNGRAWPDSDKTLNLLIDLKTPANPTLDILIEKLKQYPQVFDPQVNPNAVRVIISGDRPDPDQFHKYPSFIAFDGAHTNYTPAQLQRIALISINLRNFTQWNGKGSIIASEYEAIKKTIDKAHSLGKPIRFWATPDGITAWNTMHQMGVDYINTDNPEACAAFFRDFHKKNYQIGTSVSDNINDIARAQRLDKTTATFAGFRNEQLHLAQGTTIYRPSYKNDGTQLPVKNVILLIGDGMGLAQLSAAETVNHGLTILTMKHIGLQQTSANDAYTTDSAAAGSAIATGQKTNNRHIAASPDGRPNTSLTDTLYSRGFACGVVTLGNIADATPAAFYAHTTERDNAEQITAQLLDGKLTLLCGSGIELFKNRTDNLDLTSQLQSKAKYSIQTSISNINKQQGKVICLDARMADAANNETITLLADATNEAITKLTNQNSSGFFLMVEGAKIDYAGHANSLPGSIIETLSFDLAVAEALKFADKDGQTLVIVTGDHETGGLTLVDGNREQRLITAQYFTDDHTPIMLPVFAYGPKSNTFAGAYQNTDIFHRILRALTEQ